MLAPQLIEKACAPHSSEQCWPHQVKLPHTLPECFSKDHASLRFSEPKDKQRQISYFNVFLKKIYTYPYKKKKNQNSEHKNCKLISGFFVFFSVQRFEIIFHI